MRCLIACEFSGIVRDAFAAQGWDAWSCDLLKTERPGQHIIGNVTAHLDEGWQLLIGHPPCTYLCNSAVFRLHKEEGRWEKMRQAALFFRQLLNAPVNHVCVENPIMHGYAKEIIGRGHDQTIQPYEFGEDASKKTCLWLRQLPRLTPTKYVEPRLVCRRCKRAFNYNAASHDCPGCGAEAGTWALPRWANQTDSGQNKLGPSPDRWKDRSRTYHGIAAAMATQWTEFLSPQ